MRDNRYAFLGHSLGAILVYELCNKIKQAGFPDPIHVFFSGRYPPHIKKDEFNLYHLPDNELIEAIVKMGGTSKELFEYKELRDIFLPILKADLKLNDTYEYVAREWQYDFDITVLNGRNDHEITETDLREWANYTKGKCSIYEFDGDHFFINQYMTEITAILNRVLAPGMADPG